ncbi:unnamed protein product [Rotaria sp. Silwood1]|nr:unnamed protein product [Rotaria sp. Silwood1]
MRQKSRIRDNTRHQNLKERSNGKQFSSYRNRQCFGKAVKRVIQSLPQDTDKHVTLVRHIAQELNVIPKPITQHQCQQLISWLYVDTEINLSLTSFNDLRRMNILVQSYTPERSCLCMYHETMNLLLKPLSKYIRCPGLHSLQ